MRTGRPAAGAGCTCRFTSAGRPRRAGEAIAHEQWRSNVFPPPACWDIDSVEVFDAVSQDVTIERVRQVVNISSDLGWHTAQLAAYAELGFDEIALHHVGQRQGDWIEVFGAKVLPQLREASTEGT